MSIPPPPSGVPLNLTAATPSQLDATTLEAQLENIGLSCAEITPTSLQQYISEVVTQIPPGTVQSFAITAPAGSVSADTLPASLATSEAIDAVALMQSAPVGSLAAAIPASQQAAIGNWTELDSAEGYQPNLEVIQFPAHFDWLVSQNSTNGFAGVVDNPPAYTGNYPNAAAIQNLFINVGVTASSTVVKGIDQSTMTAVFSNVIQPLADANLKNYDQTGSRAIMLVDNYNTTTRAADGVGVVSVDWRLQISDWQRKTKDGGDTHPTILTISARAVLYSDVTLLCQHYNAVLKQFGIDPAQAPSCRTI
jgi:hypothetical protein